VVNFVHVNIVNIVVQGMPDSLSVSTVEAGLQQD